MSNIKVVYDNTRYKQSKQLKFSDIPYQTFFIADAGQPFGRNLFFKNRPSLENRAVCILFPIEHTNIDFWEYHSAVNLDSTFKNIQLHQVTLTVEDRIKP